MKNKRDLFIGWLLGENEFPFFKEDIEVEPPMTIIEEEIK